VINKHKTKKIWQEVKVEGGGSVNWVEGKDGRKKMNDKP
jgi:hypothetical protein